MPLVGDDWLALAPEPTLEPEVPICDPHHHLWVHRPEPTAYQQYLLADLAADLNSGHNVRSTVFIEVRAEYRTDGPEELRPVGEVEFVQKIADESAGGAHGPARAAAAIIGKADLKLGEGVRPVLEALRAASPNRFRGVRHSVGWDPTPELAVREIQGVLGTDGYRAGARVLAEMGFLLDNSLYFPQLGELADFANAIPELTIVLNHIGGLVRVGSYANRDDEVLAGWRKGLAAVAKCPNIVIKLGGVGQARYGFDWSKREVPVGSEELAGSLAPLMSYCIEQFGPSRCMFESNFPVDKVSYSYNVVYNAFKRLSQGYTAAERAAMFHDTAARVYRIDA
ncbi:MAG: amidohydrolase family protein [Dehalococcoidia bacterium]|nr:amidohydrolase family protein [Dehalococcoidia bacterium]